MTEAKYMHPDNLASADVFKAYSIKKVWVIIYFFLIDYLIGIQNTNLSFLFPIPYLAHDLDLVRSMT